MGVRLISAAPDAEIRDSKVRFTAEPAMPAAADMAWWSGHGAADFIEDCDGRRTGTEDAIRFNELIFGTCIEDLEDLEDREDLWSEVMGFADGDLRLSRARRKSDLHHIG